MMTHEQTGAPSRVSASTNRRDEGNEALRRAYTEAWEKHAACYPVTGDERSFRVGFLASLDWIIEHQRRVAA